MNTSLGPLKHCFDFLFSLLLFFTASNLEAQSYFSISLGRSYPFGDFASRDVLNQASGFANHGFTLDLSTEFKIHKRFGLSVLLRGQVNSIDAQSLAENFSNQAPGYDVSVATKGWSIGGFMVGGYYEVWLTENFRIHPNLMIGYLNASSPEISLTLSSNGDSAWSKTASSQTSAFSYILGTRAIYDLSKKFIISLNLDYLGSNPEFKEVQTTSSAGIPKFTSFSQSFGTINLGLGLGYKW